LADAVGIDEADVESERYQVVVQNLGVECEVGNDQGPAGEKRNKAEKGGVGVLTALSAGGHDILCTAI
jgi:hypothetical protein